MNNRRQQGSQNYCEVPTLSTFLSPVITMKHFTSDKTVHDGHSSVALAMPLHNTALSAPKWPTTACSPHEKASAPCSPFLWLVFSRPSASIARLHFHLTTKRHYNAPHNSLHSNTGYLFYPTTEIYQTE
jgi:hypothetical protein